MHCIKHTPVIVMDVWKLLPTHQFSLGTQQRTRIHTQRACIWHIPARACSRRWPMLQGHQTAWQQKQGTCMNSYANLKLNTHTTAHAAVGARMLEALPGSTTLSFTGLVLKTQARLHCCRHMLLMGREQHRPALRW